MDVHRQLIALCLGAAAVVVLGTARGQAPPMAPTVFADLPAQVFAGTPPVSEQPSAPDPAEAKKQEHLQKIKQLTFDRRPSSILKAWSTPREEAVTRPEADDSAPPTVP